MDSDTTQGHYANPCDPCQNIGSMKELLYTLEKPQTEYLVRKSIKIPLYVFLVLILISLIAISIAPLVFDPNDYKVEIAHMVKKQTGRNLNIEGDLKLQVLPKLAVTTEKISLGNRAGFGQQTFMKIDHAYFRIRLIPLFSKQIKIKKIVLRGVDVHLVRREDNQTNWGDLSNPSDSTTKRPIPIRYQNLQPGLNQAVASPLAALVATKIDIFDAEVNLDDKVSGNHVVVQDIEFIMGRFGFNQSVYVKLQGSLANSKPPFREAATISGQIFVNENLDNFRVEKFRWASQLDGDLIPVEFRQAELTTAAEINLANHTLSATNLRLIANQTSIGANISASRILEKPELDASISIDQANPGKIMQLAGIEYTPKDPAALQTLNGKFTLALNESKLDIKDIALILDGNPIKGVASVDGFESPKIKFNFSAKQLHADRYLPESRPPQSPPKPKPPAGISVVGSKPRGLVNGVASPEPAGTSFQGILNLGSLRLMGLLAEGVQLAFHGSNGVVRSNQRFKQFYNGRFKGSIEYNYRKPRPVISVNQRLTGVEVGPLLKDLNGKTPIEGTLQATVRLIGHGAQSKTFKSTLNGDIDALLTNGELRGINLLKVIRESKAFVKPSGVKSGSMADMTKFSKLKYKATVINGVVNNTRLEAKSTSLDFSGGGKIYLANDAVDYHIDAVINDNPEGIASIKIKELKGVRVPIQIGGFLGKLTYQPDIKGVLKDPKVKAVAKKLKQKIHKKLGAGTRELLNNLF